VLEEEGEEEEEGGGFEGGSAACEQVQGGAWSKDGEGDAWWEGGREGGRA